MSGEPPTLSPGVPAPRRLSVVCWRGRQRGVALVAALLTMAAVMTLALASFVLVRFDIALTRNRQDLALARAEAGAAMVVALLELEDRSRDGELPESFSGPAGLDSYDRESPHLARISVVAGSGSGSERHDARVELRNSGAGWRLHVLELR